MPIVGVVPDPVAHALPSGLANSRAGGVREWVTSHATDEFIVSLRSRHNDKYVSAEINYTGANYGMLRGRCESQGGWETFYINEK